MSASLIEHFDLLATATGGVARLRELILTLAVQGKLVPQDPSDEQASVLLQRIDHHVKAGAVKGKKALADDEVTASPPYKLPPGWGWAKLGGLVEHMGSGWSPACDEGERSDPMRWSVLRTTAVQVMEYLPREHKAIPLKLTPRPEIEVQDGDILITRAGPMNRVGISCCVSQTPSRLMLSDKIVRFHSIADEMLPNFVVLALNAGWTKKQIESAKTGMAASQVNISQTDIKNLLIPVCSKVEQSRIVARVEELMRLCDALDAKGKLDAAQHMQLVQRLLGTLTDSASPAELAANWQRVAEHFDLLLDRSEAVDALEQTILQLAVRGLLVPQDPNDEPASVLLQKIRTEKDRLIAEGKIKRDKPLAPISDEEKLFELPAGWEWLRVGDAVYMLNGYAFKSEWFKPSGVRLLRNLNVGHGRLDWSQPVFLNESSASDYEQFRLAEGDIVLSLDRPIISTGLKLAVLKDSDLPCLLLQRVAKLVPETMLISGDFLVLWMQSDLFMATIDPGRSNGVPHISTKQVTGLVLGLPPLAEQSRIVACVEELRQLCSKLRQRLTASRTTQGLLADALVAAVVSPEAS